MRQQLWNAKDDSSKTFELATPVIARFYWTQYNNRVQNIHMIVENPINRNLPNGGHYVESKKASFIYWYTNGHQVRYQ